MNRCTSGVRVLLAVAAVSLAACSEPTSPDVPVDLQASLGKVANPSNGTAPQCKDGGWQALGFSNQGQCVRWVETGKDSRPASCQEIRDSNADAADGDYLIVPGGQPFTVYCHDMAGTPAEYLSLQNTGPGFNYGRYTAGGGKSGTTVTTHYAKVRLDPAALAVNIGDQTFASSTGTVYHDGVITSMPLGVAMACVSPNNPAGNANIDLRGTPFAVDNAFSGGGFAWAGSIVFSSADQVVDLTGGGYCGWTTPAAAGYFPVNGGGGYSLQLRFAAP